MPELKAAVFDLDDSLVALHAAKRRSYQFAADQGVDVERMRAVEYGLWTQFAEGTMTWDRLRILRWTESGVTLQRALELDPEFTRIAQNVYCRPGAKALLGQLREMGIKRGVLTNATGKGQREKMERCGLTPYLDAIGVSEEIGHGKPDRRAFEYVCERLGVYPDECVMVGDDFARDILGAQGAGFQQLVWTPNVYARDIERTLEQNPQVRLARQLSDVMDVLDLAREPLELAI